MLLAGLTTGHKIGLLVVAAVFITFALSSSFLAPRKRPDFPGRNGLSVFVIASLVLFAGMLSAVWIFGAEPKEAKGAETAKAAVVQVTEKEYSIALSPTKVPHGAVTFVVRNAGKIPHNLTVQGGKATPDISPGKTAKLTVTLKHGSTTVYCSIPGHRALGMVAKLTVS